MEQKYITTELRSIPVEVLKKEIASLVTETICDYGKSLDIDIQTHLIKRVFEILMSVTYKSWQWREVMTAFENGKVGTYGGESRVSVAGILRWLKGYSSNRISGIVDEQIKRQKVLSNETKSLHFFPELGEALIWKMRNCTREERDLFQKLGHGSYLKQIAEYLKEGKNPKILIDDI